jgi:hypothetical protein
VFAVARVGTRLLVRGSAGKGGTYLALALKESALAGEPSTRRLGLGGILGAEGGQRSTSLETDAVVQDLRLRKHALTANAWLPDGQVLVLRSSVDVARGGEHLVVALRRADGGGDDALEELRTGGRRVTAVDLDRASPPAFAPHVEAEAWTGPLPSDLVVSHARAASSDSPLYLAARLVEPYEPGLLGLLADRLTMSDVKVLQQGPRWFFLGPESVQTADLASVQPPAPDATLLEVELFDASGRVVQSLALPTRVGTWSLAALGTESLECFDHDVEVAQYAGASDPVAHTVLDGALLALLPTRGPDGELRVEARVRAHVRNAERREADLQGMLSLKVDELDFDHLIADEELVLAGPESRVVLGDASGGSAGVRRGLSLVVRAR